MKYFFSAIGGNDPVSSATEYDGSMLHICRHYLPDEVYLYLSQEMVMRQRKDDRYRYCIDKLGALLNHRFEVTCIENAMQNEVQEYDFYYEAFEPFLKKITNKMEKADVLYVNIASGTPAMKSALLLLSVMSEKNVVPVQVLTPTREINVHTGKDRDYDPEYYWEINRDNEADAPNRCREPQCPNLIYRLKRQILIRYLQSYNYAAAFMLGEELKDEMPDGVYSLLELAVARMQLDLRKVNMILTRFSEDEKKAVLPIRDGDAVKVFEYSLSLQIKIARKEYCDFVRAISPLLTDLFEMILKRQFGIDLGKYCDDHEDKKYKNSAKRNNRTYDDQDKKNRRSSGVRKWNVNKLRNTEEGRRLLKLLEEEFHNEFKNTAVAASNLKPLLVYFLKDEKVKASVIHLRDIEAKIRNLAAHEIVSITDENISDIVGEAITIADINKELQTLTQSAVRGVKKESWNSYDEMNRLIIDKLLKEALPE